MKKLTAILIASVVIWGCSKKMSPNTTTSTGGNNGTVVNNAPVPMGESKNNANTNTAPANTTPVENTGEMGSKVAPVPTAETAKLMQGQATYNAKCGRCHGLKVTTDYTAERWISIMQVMAIKARLDETEKANVLAYVQANSKK